ncbi:hypothetical protein [Segetibacter koreensis]|uniref:hypothetical protein n=1 Tax=Segetibacter koreensis TaxID=398037 RepID=UPI0003753758|nr:hypothetical protein [Segetibacter koreensis]
MMKEVQSYKALVGEIGALLLDARKNARRAVNTILVNTDWQLENILLNLNRVEKKKRHTPQNYWSVCQKS